MKIWQQLFGLFLVMLLCVGCSKVESIAYNPWDVIVLPTEEKILDIAFTENPEHGYLVGSNSTLLETQDGGSTWEQIALQLDNENYRFNSVSFSNEEGWIVGEPALMLHTTDEGHSWLQVPLSEKLPGTPVNIVALGENTAEMATDVGAIYKTTDGGKNWKAQVEGAVGIVRNMERAEDGRYVAVSAKGNFYSTWEPGQQTWQPHNRNSSRKVENMGFTGQNQMWMLARGGQIQFTDPDNMEEWQDPLYPELSTSWGLLDVAYRTPDEVWVSGGSANLLRSTDGGQTWEKDRFVEEVPSNFFKVVFLSEEKGFVIGDRGGYLLKYNPDVSEVAPRADEA